MMTFLNKEITEHIRDGKIFVCACVFFLMGILSPAIAKFTPNLYEMMSEELNEMGMKMSEIKVTAFDSYTQFYKNLPITIIVFVLLFAGIFTVEYQKQTLVMMITKGLSRMKVLLAKTLFLILLWSVMYFGYFFITQGYTMYFWDTSVAKNMAFAVMIGYIFGIFIISLMVMFSVIANSMSGVLLGCGGPVALYTMLAIIPKVGKYFPTKLLDGMSLLRGELLPKDYRWALLVTVFLIVINFIIAAVLFRKKAL